MPITENENVNVKISADFGKVTGKIKPMHGVGQPPMQGMNADMMHYLGEAGIPYSRLHDVQGWLGHDLYVDIPNVFRNFDADVEDPASYDFTFTDQYMKRLVENGVEPFYRLGVTIENAHLLKSYRIFPPKDNLQWARICEHIIRHYNEGWANGYRMNVTYWEIWNEPDDCFRNETAAMWKGTPEEYFALYDVTSKHLKKCFGDSIRVGGFASCGFWGYKDDPDMTKFRTKGSAKTDRQFYLEFAHRFFAYVKENNCPLDFFSWHTYDTIENSLAEADYCRRMMSMYGFDDVPDILNEWNMYIPFKGRDSAENSAKTLAFMLGMQKKQPSLLCYYDARIGSSRYGGMFSADNWEPFRSYYAFVSFNAAYKLGNEVETSSSGEKVFVLGAKDDAGRKLLLIANYGDTAETLEFDVTGADMAKGEVIITDEEYLHTLTGITIRNNTLRIKPYSCIEIRL